MNSSVLAYLENSAEYFPEKCAVTDEKVSYSYSELVKLSSSVGTALSELIVSGDAVGIYMEKCADAVADFILFSTRSFRRTDFRPQFPYSIQR